MSSTYLMANAWREMLARIFSATECRVNVSPEWLINPSTRRRLKLDYLYPEIGVAVRFAGLTAKGQRRHSDWEALEDEQRNQTRLELCRINGIQLAIVDPSEEPDKQLERILRVLSRANRLMAHSRGSKKEKRQAMDQLASAIQEANQIYPMLNRGAEGVMVTLAERWRDREAGLIVALQEEATTSPEQGGVANLFVAELILAQQVVHNHFGNGVVTAIVDDGSDKRITVLFDADRERTFLASRLAGKLRPAS